MASTGSPTIQWEALDLALAGGGTGCMIVMFANPLAGAFCELDVGVVKVTVNMLWDRKQNGAATVGGVACAVGGEVSEGVSQSLNEFCDALATTVENLMSYKGRH
jgi:Ni,Fe-hydrogenase III large subunit